MSGSVEDSSGHKVKLLLSNINFLQGPTFYGNRKLKPEEEKQ